MSQLEPQSGDTPSSDDAGRPMEGNRPANNASRATPGSLSTQAFQGGGEVSDFLGLEAEMGAEPASSGAFELMSDPGAEAPQVVQQGRELEPEAAQDEQDEDLQEESNDPFVAQDVQNSQYDQAYELDQDESLDASLDQDHDEAQAEYQDDEQDEPAFAEQSAATWNAEDDSPSAHTSWQDEQPKGSGVGKLIGMAVGMLVLGMLGMAGYKFMSAAGQGEPQATAPLSASANTGAGASASSATELVAPVEDAGEDLASNGFDSTDGSADGEAVGEFSNSSADEAREAFDAVRGNEPPVWFDPTLDSNAVAPETGWTPEAEAVTEAATPEAGTQVASTPILGDPEVLAASGQQADTLELVADAGSETAGDGEVVDSPPSEVLELVGGSVAATTEAGDAGQTATQDPVSTTKPYEVASLIGSNPPGASASTSTAPATSAGTTSVVSATSAAVSEPQPVTAVVAAQPADAQTSVGPPRPVGASTTVLPADGAVAGLNQSRQSRTSTLKVEDVLLAPTMDSSNLRQADAKDLAGVWSESTVPMQAIDSKNKVLTPSVGRVRVILKSKDIFEGRLYAIGQGNVWIENEAGRMAVTGTRIAAVEQLDSKDGTPELGSTGSQDLSGMARVRVKTPGGTFYGKVISRDDSKTTLITDDGARLTLDSKDVEFLSDVPKVSIGGKVETKGSKP